VQPHLYATLYIGGIPAAVAALLYRPPGFLLHDALLTVTGTFNCAIWIAVFWLMGALKFAV
jgi:hypothetical protein